MGIVDALEVIDVDDGEPQRRLAPAPVPASHPETVGERPPVHDPGKRVRLGDVRQSLDLAMDAHQGRDPHRQDFELALVLCAEGVRSPARDIERAVTMAAAGQRRIQARSQPAGRQNQAIPVCRGGKTIADFGMRLAENPADHRALYRDQRIDVDGPLVLQGDQAQMGGVGRQGDGHPVRIEHLPEPPGDDLQYLVDRFGRREFVNEIHRHVQRQLPVAGSRAGIRDIPWYLHARPQLPQPPMDAVYNAVLSNPSPA